MPEKASRVIQRGPSGSPGARPEPGPGPPETTFPPPSHEVPVAVARDSRRRRTSLFLLVYIGSYQPSSATITNALFTSPPSPLTARRAPTTAMAPDEPLARPAARRLPAAPHYALSSIATSESINSRR